MFEIVMGIGDFLIQLVKYCTYERSYGKLKGSVILDGKKYVVTQADGYFDHMIPYTSTLPVWEMEIHGWSWSEITTDKYQTIFYGVRGTDDGYQNYTYKHLTLIDKCTGRVIAEYSGDKVKVIEEGWTNVVVKGNAMKRPSRLKISTPDLRNS